MNGLGELYKKVQYKRKQKDIYLTDAPQVLDVELCVMKFDRNEKISSFTLSSHFY